MANFYMASSSKNPDMEDQHHEDHGAPTTATDSATTSSEDRKQEQLVRRGSSPAERRVGNTPTLTVYGVDGQGGGVHHPSLLVLNEQHAPPHPQQKQNNSQHHPPPGPPHPPFLQLRRAAAQGGVVAPPACSSNSGGGQRLPPPAVGGTGSLSAPPPDFARLQQYINETQQQQSTDVLPGPGGPRGPKIDTNATFWTTSKGTTSSTYESGGDFHDSALQHPRAIVQVPPPSKGAATLATYSDHLSSVFYKLTPSDGFAARAAIAGYGPPGDGGPPPGRPLKDAAGAFFEDGPEQLLLRPPASLPHPWGQQQGAGGAAPGAACGPPLVTIARSNLAPYVSRKL